MTEPKPPDPRVQTHLNALGLRFTVSDAGLFTVAFEVEGDRTQDVHIASATTFIDQLEIRDVYSYGLSSETPLHADIANALLAYNDAIRLGAWKLLRGDGDSCSAVFCIPIAANTTANALLFALETAVKHADLMAERFVGEDCY